MPRVQKNGRARQALKPFIKKTLEALIYDTKLVSGPCRATATRGARKRGSVTPVFEQYEDEASVELGISREPSWSWNEKLALWKSS